MIQFRCWYCHRRYAVEGRRAGESFACSCKHLLRVPRRSGGNCRVKSAVDWLVEGVVYGGGGALLGLVLALLLLSQVPGAALVRRGWLLIPGLTLAGFLFGLLGGERGVNWVGRQLREREGR
jgi:hypothetical protein